MVNLEEESINYSEEDKLNFRTRLSIVADDIRFIKTQIWAITYYGLLVYGINIWIFEKFLNIWQDKNWILYICVVLNVVVLIVVWFLHYKIRESLKKNREREK